MPGDAGQFRDYLLDRGMSSSSVRRVFISDLQSITKIT